MDSKRSVALFDNSVRSSKKRRRKEDEEIDDLLLEIDNEVDQDDDDDDEFIFATVIPEAVSILNNGENTCMCIIKCRIGKNLTESFLVVSRFFLFLPF